MLSGSLRASVHLQPFARARANGWRCTDARCDPDSIDGNALRPPGRHRAEALCRMQLRADGGNPAPSGKDREIATVQRPPGTAREALRTRGRDGMIDPLEMAWLHAELDHDLDSAGRARLQAE